jgi:hypothetical protein
MLKIIAILLVLLCALAGCGSPSYNYSSGREEFHASADDPPVILPNTIRLLELTEREQYLVGLTGGSERHTWLFECEVIEPFTMLEVWVETYEKGVVKQGPTTRLVMERRETQPWNGIIGVAMDSSEFTFWGKEATEFSLALWDSEDSVYEIREPNMKYPAPKPPSQSSVFAEPLSFLVTSPQIILYQRVFGEDEIIIPDDPQEYVYNPGALHDLEYVQLVKCRFSIDQPQA